ncbi:TonB-dependent receptor [Gelidibacter sp.]|uniref:TonB-dependent receptor n=1 Tax=Gelidibacter sp. TaxID=2018083 RepID=UPI002D05192A|nr:carboxypeptidase-like regulatory domain-containing protein [Gelidibacter sp.]HUH29237.1 carboxypeptidase-like regulatory domain-containing protein [Gelidibacter sp.]
MKAKVFFLIFFTTVISFGQTTISGKVTDLKGLPIQGANVYLEGTYDGGTTDILGRFSFNTNEMGVKTLVVSFLAFETFKKLNEVVTMSDLQIKLREDVNTLDAVVLSAGTFEAGDNSKVSVLSTLDVVTTASALGDFVGALQTLPGTTTVAEDGRLFVRGGEADETQIFIDGIRVFTPYSPTTNNTPTRGRYSPFLFDGITFSTGGYSAEYGQALSSVLLLNTIAEADQNKTEIGIMTLGGGLGNTQKWTKSSLSVNASYINLAPYIAVFPDRNAWEKPFQSASGEAVYRQHFDKGMLKIYTAFETSNFGLIQEDINYSEGVHFKLNENNLYFNGSYQGMLTDVWSVFGGMSYTHRQKDVGVRDSGIDDTENSYHTKFKLKRRFSNRLKLNFGAEYFSTHFNENYQDNLIAITHYGFTNDIAAAFAEADFIFSKKLALKAGLRADYSQLFKATEIAPRMSLAYKTSKRSQLSLAYGNFYQNPNNDILKFDQSLQPQHTAHFILNYQYNVEGRMFRAEAYYKNYKGLIKYDSELLDFETNFDNSGRGFAKGIDLFWRDNKNIKNVDYWVSYSFLDSERDYKNYPYAAQPNFVNTHNFSVVSKYWIDALKSQVGFSYAFASGRNYTDPNSEGFLNAKTKPYNNLSLNWAYLLSSQKILYFSVNNVLGIKNINGYQYATTADANGNFSRRALLPAADQFFFVGFFWTISDKGTDNQLDNL